MELREIFKHVAHLYEMAKAEPFAKHPLAMFIRSEAPPAIARAIGNSYFKVTGSPGKGSWKETPWFGVFAIKELQRRADLIRAILPEYPQRFSDGPIDYGSTSDLARDYEPSIAFGTTYDLAGSAF